MRDGTAEAAEEVSARTPAADPERADPGPADPERVEHGGSAAGRITPAPDIEALERLRNRLMAKHYGRRR